MVRALFSLFIALSLLAPPGMCWCQVFAHDHDELPADAAENDRCCDDHGCNANDAPHRDPCPTEPHKNVPECPGMCSAGLFKVVQNLRITIVPPAVVDFAVAIPSPLHSTVEFESRRHFSAHAPPLFLSHCTWLI